ncbi:MAG: signal peptide peptidase SppA [Flavobacteriaceae bacterium]|nr:signal peptide peptidase SppA [Flavobacteriaceae bacterium]RPG66992.1 MAG: signal peptide peptidase SppA [Flavobacteriaceae bacterium TMED42]|tara:strand:- start:4506 stop:6260 length:1755 start_codon:yes stop_codon:yes gene_type:complete
MNFFKSFLASLMGTFIAMGLVALFFFMGIAAIATSLNLEQSKGTWVKENSVLGLNLNTMVTDRSPNFNPLEGLSDFDSGMMGMDEIIGSIKKAKQDDKIKGIKLQSGFIASGWAQAREIRNALKEFKNSGKFIYAYGDYMSQKGYYVSSVADSIFMNPMGMMQLKGLSSEVLYYEDFQNQYGVKMEVIRHGKYKSAVEPYLQDHMSEENRTQIQSLLNAVWETLRDEVAQSRGLESATLDALADDLVVTDAEEALAQGIIDGLVYEDDFEDKIKATIEVDPKEDLKVVDSDKINIQIQEYDNEISDHIAIVYAQGPILNTKGSAYIIGKEAINKAFQEILESDKIKAVVLRVDSPGGDALTSEIILNASRALKGKKPLVVSMGNVAASGGYYISSLADRIFADPMTITGSIGVLAAFPNIRGMTNRIGINAEQVTTHKNAMGYSPFEPLSEGFEKSTISAIEKVYHTFKSRVSEGRSLSMEIVEEIAQGRVWSGKNAVEIGLVDTLGGLQEAITGAAELAKIDKYNLVDYPKYDDDFESMLLNAFSQAQTKLFQHPIEKYASDFIKLSQLEGIQTRIPYSIKME